MIKVKINGKEEKVNEGITVLALLEEKSVRPEMVAVELNGDLLNSGEYEKTLNDGDILEFLYYMAGGQQADLNLKTKKEKLQIII